METPPAGPIHDRPWVIDRVYPKPLLPVTATVGGQPATVVYAGAAPGLAAGVLQVNVRIPDGIPSGNAAVQLKIGSAVSRAGVTVAVK